MKKFISLILVLVVLSLVAQTNVLTYISGVDVGTKYYRATLTQTGTNAPVANVVHNDLGGTVVWARSSPGIFTATLTGAFVTNKTTLFISPGFAATVPTRTSANVITIDCDGSDGNLAGNSFQVIVDP